MIQEGIVRARYRNSDSEVSLIEPGKIYEYTIDLWATSYVVKQGHRIIVEISSSNFNRWDRNPNTGHEFGMDAETMKATQTIYHDKQHPSHITLPVIPR
jgi:putative CocE/NonD family hydrolase